MSGSLLETSAKENLHLVTDCSAEGGLTQSYWTAQTTSSTSLRIFLLMGKKGSCQSPLNKSKQAFAKDRPNHSPE